MSLSNVVSDALSKNIWFWRHDAEAEYVVNDQGPLVMAKNVYTYY